MKKLLENMVYHVVRPPSYLVLTTLAMMMLTFAAPAPAGTWTMYAAIPFIQTFATAATPWTKPPWIPLVYIMDAEAYTPPSIPPLRMIMGVGR